MKIDSSNVGMESARSYRASNTVSRRFSITEYRQGSLGNLNNSLNTAVKGGQSDAQAGKSANNGAQTENVPEKRLYTLDDWRRDIGFSSDRVKFRSSRSESYMDDFRQATIRYIFDLLFSNRRKLWGASADESGADSGFPVDNTSSNNAQSAANGSQTNAANGGQNFTGIFATNMRVLSYSEEQTFFEQEDTSFSTVGTVRTSDGREINFNVNIGMSRQFQSAFRDDLQAANLKMCDPLVINLDTDVAELSDQKFFFDIDADGTLDEISQLDGRSGYLALDKNGDGVINDGSELFGTASGDGFADLAKYDDDGNGWIDENDAIWSKLQIWCKDANGQDVLYRLADKGVGAICLQRAATDFTLQGAQGQSNGAIRSTGVFLYENGNVGTVQHVDVAKYEQGA